MKVSPNSLAWLVTALFPALGTGCGLMLPLTHHWVPTTRKLEWRSHKEPAQIVRTDSARLRARDVYFYDTVLLGTIVNASLCRTTQQTTIQTLVQNDKALVPRPPSGRQAELERLRGTRAKSEESSPWTYLGIDFGMAVALGGVGAMCIATNVCDSLAREPELVGGTVAATGGLFVLGAVIDVGYLLYDGFEGSTQWEERKTKDVLDESECENQPLNASSGELVVGAQRFPLSLDPSGSFSVSFDGVADTAPLTTHSFQILVQAEAVRLSAVDRTAIADRIDALVKEKKRRLEEAEREHALAEREHALAEERRVGEERRAKELARQEALGEQRDRFARKHCGGEILSHRSFLLGKNPYADIGKCVEFRAVTVQMLSTDAGLFNIGDNNLVFIQFGDTFRGSLVDGLARIDGMYSYTTVGGLRQTVPRLRMLHVTSSFTND